MTDRPVLGAFLRARREQLSPADAGLRDTGRRRTPGLRREEVATLAGVSIDYLVRLEQGRDTNPSREVVLALADALQLSDVEREHLARLASIGDRIDLCPTVDQSQAVVPETVLQIARGLEPTPAFVVGGYGDVLGWNDAWGALVGPLGMRDGAPPNLARYVFQNPAARTVYADWSAAADEQVGTLRLASGLFRDDPRFNELMAELHGNQEFERRWSTHAIVAKRRGSKTVRHPALGELRLAYEVLLLPDEDGQRLITWLAADDATAARLAEAAGTGAVSPARLRVVGDE